MSKQKLQDGSVGGAGIGGYCICPKCKHKIKHERNKPCSYIKCSKCGTFMQRQISQKTAKDFFVPMNIIENIKNKE